MRGWALPHKSKLKCKHCKRVLSGRNPLYCDRLCMHAAMKFDRKKWKRDFYQNRAGSDICPTCGGLNESGNVSRCDRCSLVRAERRMARIESGTCIQCKSPAVAAIYCMHHWFTRIGHQWGHTVANGGVDMIKRLWAKQKGRCALTGDVLVPGGKRASLDHIVPRTRGGDSSESNLQWVTYESNRAKNDMTDDELVAWCKKVLTTKGLATTVERTN
jgi:5-methylcytosine-specific restriction endonuclease McrA